MAMKTKIQAEITRKKIIDSAIWEFAEYGFNNTSLYNISIRAGVTRGAIYYYFKNKDQLYNYIWLEIISSIGDIEQDCIARNAESPLQAIREIFLGYFKLIDKDSYGRLKVKIIFRTYENNDNLLSTYENKRQLAAICREWMEGILRNSIRLGELPSQINIEQAVVLFNIYIVGVIKTWLMDPKLFNIKQEMDVYINYFINSLKESY